MKSHFHMKQNRYFTLYIYIKTTPQYGTGLLPWDVFKICLHMVLSNLK